MTRSRAPGRATPLGRVLYLALASLVLALSAAVHAAASAPGLLLYDAGGRRLGQAPRLQTEVRFEVTGVLARVRVEQRFHNPGAAWVEGVYVFPLPETAAVDRLRMRYAGRLIEGEIQEKRQARQTYAEARARGQGAGLLEQQRANIFTTALANIPPGETVEVAIEYQHLLRWRDGEFVLRFPLVVGPRYIPGRPRPSETGQAPGHGWASATDQVPDADRITPPVVVGAPPQLNPVRISAALHLGLEAAAIDSPYHPIRVEQPSAGEYQVTLVTAAVPADRDFVLRWRPRLAQQPVLAAFGERWRGRHYGLLLVMPPRPAAAASGAGRELILVVDTSGSMHGDSIAQARAALLSALRQLAPRDRFNIIRFDQRVEQLFERAMPADPERLARARRFVHGLRAEGGTEMLPAMRQALHDPAPSGLLRQVVFLTDGAIGNEQALFAAVARDIGRSRLFTVGIGSAPNALFMRHAAAFGRGTFTYIGSGAEVEERVGGLFRQLAAPALTDVRLEWEGDDGSASLVQAPARPADLYAGEPLVVALQSDRPLYRVRLTGRLGGRPWRHTVALSDAATGNGVHALWARRRIDDWLARQVTGEAVARVRDAVLGLALEHQLLSRYTSLVAVDRTPRRPADAALASAPVPTRLPAGWSAQAVFGRLPDTATSAPLVGLLGLLGLALGVWLRRCRR